MRVCLCLSSHTADFLVIVLYCAVCNNTFLISTWSAGVSAVGHFEDYQCCYEI